MSPGSGKLVLVVDDERDIVDFVTDLLKSEGYQTATAHDGQQALTVIEEKRPDAVVLDIKMPVLDGIGVIRKVREAPELANTPIVVFTATQVIHESKEQFKELGVFCWFAKPFESDDLLKAIEGAIQSK